LTTRVGTITLRVPQIRGRKFSTELFARYHRNEQALVPALMEMVADGVSTRKVAQITEELCGTKFSKSTVSELCKHVKADYFFPKIAGLKFPRRILWILLFFFLLKSFCA